MLLIPLGKVPDFPEKKSIFLFFTVKILQLACEKISVPSDRSSAEKGKRSSDSDDISY